MIEGLWTIEFRSSLGNTGYGIVIFQGSRAMGGTSAYYFFGDYRIEGDTLVGSLRVQRFNESVESVFGKLENFDLKLSGTVDESKMIIAGRVVEHPDLKMAAICTKRQG
jgi:hypothetical protein